MAAAMLTLSIVDYIHGLKQAGVSEQAVEFHARQFEQTTAEIAQIAAKTKEEVKHDIKQKFQIDSLATKNDIILIKNDITLAKKELEVEIEKVRTEIHKIRYDTFKFIVWTGVGVVAALGGMLAKGFHWF